MQRFFNSIDFIEQHLYDKISVHEVAAASHYSTYHFSRIFKVLVGDTPKEYLRKRRLTVSAKRLLSEDIGILELAFDCQFDSQEAFTRAFKDLFNIIIYLRIIMLVLIRNGLIDCLIIVSEFGKKIFIII